MLLTFTSKKKASLDPTQPFTALYQLVRRKYTSELSYDLKILFLAQIPSYVQTSLYRIRRQIIPPIPSSQIDIDVNLDWFLVSRNPDESLVKGDIVHSERLRLSFFSTDQNYFV